MPLPSNAKAIRRPIASGLLAQSVKRGFNDFNFSDDLVAIDSGNRVNLRFTSSRGLDAPE
ncbi:MAG: hypothetical protein WA485_11740 [Candidatus Sulfotelmatobacter sp.]